MISRNCFRKIDEPLLLILLMVGIQCTWPNLRVQGFILQDLFQPLANARRLLFPTQVTSEPRRIVKRSPGDPDENGSLIWECTFPWREITPANASNPRPPLSPSSTSLEPPDHNLCNFTMDVSQYGLQAWSQGSGMESVWLGGPKSDAQGQKSESRYAFYDTSKFYEPNERLQDRAWILSPWTPRTTVKGNCLNFKYNSQGLNIASLNLIRIDLIALIAKPDGDNVKNETINVTAPKVTQRNSLDTLSNLDLSDAITQLFEPRSSRSGSLNKYRFQTNLVWSSSDTTNGHWEGAHYSYATRSNHVFAWEVRPDLGGTGNARTVFNGFVAIDDIILKDGECEDECNFDAGFCQFSNDGMEDDFDWSLSRGSIKPGTGPMADQSATAFGTPRGGYAYIDSSFPRRPGDKARLTHRNAILSTPHNPLCVSFWVNLHGSGLGSLSVYALPLEMDSRRISEFLVWEVNHPPSSPRDVWNQARFTLANPRNRTKIMFEGIIGEVDRSDIAIDTVKVQPGPCPLLPESAYPLQKEAKGHFSADCTFRLGLCRWKVINQQPAKPEKMGHLLDSSSSPINIGSSSSGGPEKWKKSAKPEHLEVKRAEFVKPGSSPVFSQSKETVESLWKRVPGGLNSIPLGHTKLERGPGSTDDGEDYLMVFDTRNYHHRPLDSAYLYSEVIRGNPISVSNASTNRTEESSPDPSIDQPEVGPKCVGFWFQMAGAIASNPYLGSLKVYEVQGNFSNLPTSITSKTALWSLTNSQGPIWQYGQAPIALKSGIESRLAFLGVRANTVNGLIAIDDIVVFDGNCQVLPTRAATNPHDCSFDEGDLCGWLVVNPDGSSSDERRPQDWQLADPTHTFAHVKDHTFEVENQGFLYFDAANTQILTWLVSGPIASGQEVCFTFWFRSAAVEGAHLSVKRQYKNGTSSLLWCVKHDAIPSASMDDRSPLPWTPSQVHVPSVDEATLLILEGSSKYRGFALDDIRLFPNEPASKCTTRPEYQSTSTSSIPDDLFVRRTSRASPAASNSLNLVKRRFEETI